ncbi:hypothetical protein M5689_017365 [Euphorbia peplus]|nr:hypothetical protein M5689_017365 [Euphorbia peplus]
MQENPIGIPACFTSGDKFTDDPTTITRSGQSVFMSVYRTKIADQCRLITITWCKNLLLHGLSVSVQGPEGDQNQYACKVELKPWYFWRKQGSKRFLVDGNKSVDIFWDLKSAKFNGETEPSSEYYVAVVSDEEVVLLLGDLKKDAYRKTGCRPALIDPVLVSRREHIFGKKKFLTRMKFHEKGRVHEISIECKNNGNSSANNRISSVNNGNSSGNKGNSSGNIGSSVEPELEIRIDGHIAIHVKHLQWKFRGNQCFNLNKLRVEVYWDVHDWLFSPGLRHALFIFKPIMPISTPISSLSTTSSSVSSPTESCGSVEGVIGAAGGGSSDFSLFLYAWRVE